MLYHVYIYIYISYISVIYTSVIYQLYPHEHIPTSCPNFQVASRRNCDFDPVAVLMWSSFLELAGAPWQGWAPNGSKGRPIYQGWIFLRSFHRLLVENG